MFTNLQRTRPGFQMSLDRDASTIGVTSVCLVVQCSPAKVSTCFRTSKGKNFYFNIAIPWTYYLVEVSASPYGGTGRVNRLFIGPRRLNTDELFQIDRGYYSNLDDDPVWVSPFPNLYEGTTCGGHVTLPEAEGRNLYRRKFPQLHYDELLSSARQLIMDWWGNPWNNHISAWNTLFHPLWHQLLEVENVEEMLVRYKLDKSYYGKAYIEGTHPVWKYRNTWLNTAISPVSQLDAIIVRALRKWQNTPAKKLIIPNLQNRSEWRINHKQEGPFI